MVYVGIVVFLVLAEIWRVCVCLAGVISVWVHDVVLLGSYFPFGEVQAGIWGFR